MVMPNTAQATGSLQMGGRQHQLLQISETDLLAGTRQDMAVFSGGLAVSFQAVVQKTITTGGTLTFRNETTNKVLGSITIPNGATKGTRYVTDTGADNNSTDLKIAFGAVISVTPAGFASAGAVNLGFGINPQ